MPRVPSKGTPHARGRAVSEPTMTFADPICRYPGCQNPTVAYVNVYSGAAGIGPTPPLEARCAEHGGAQWSFEANPPGALDSALAKIADLQDECARLAAENTTLWAEQRRASSICLEWSELLDAAHAALRQIAVDAHRSVLEIPARQLLNRIEHCARAALETKP